MNSCKESVREKNVSVLITTRRQWSKFHFSVPKMSHFSILNWGGWLTRTEQLIDCDLRELKKASGVSCEFVARSIRSLLEATNMEQKIEVDRLLKEFNAESSQEISEYLQQNLSLFVSLQKAFEKFFNQKTLNSFVAKAAFFVTASEIKEH